MKCRSRNKRMHQQCYELWYMDEISTLWLTILKLHVLAKLQCMTDADAQVSNKCMSIVQSYDEPIRVDIDVTICFVIITVKSHRLNVVTFEQWSVHIPILFLLTACIIIILLTLVNWWCCQNVVHCTRTLRTLRA